MRMYAACLASYNNGDLHGKWFDLEDYSDKDELLEAIAEKVLRTSPHPKACAITSILRLTHGMLESAATWPLWSTVGRPTSSIRKRLKYSSI